MNPGVVYQGTVEELSRLGSTKGFSLSVLMLERDSDELANALRLAQQYAAEKDLSVGIAGANVEASVILEALSQLAERIAEDDVELKQIDLRFGIKGEIESGTAGKEILNLKPCTIIVSRNLDGPEFGAVATIEIRRRIET